MRRFVPAVAAVAAFALGTAVWVSTASAQSTGTGSGTAASHHDALVALQRERGYIPLPDHPQRRVPPAAAAPSDATTVRAAGHAPTAGPAWVGIIDHRHAPADPIGAAGPSSYLEFVNTTTAIYTRTGSLIQSISTEKLVGIANEADLSDPQVMWDPATNRFYFAMIDEKTNGFIVGFSRSANPTHMPGDFCSYTMDFGFGNALPDYPKLGSTLHNLLIGANVFPNDPNASIHADVAWMRKPAGTATLATCPAQSSFAKGKFTNIKDKSQTGQGWTPVPAQQTDPSGTGWVVATTVFPDIEDTSWINLYKVTEDATGKPSMNLTSTQVPVALFEDPTGNPAQQKGTKDFIDVLDGRFTHAVSAIDPGHGGALAIWTAHTVIHGANPGGTSEVRWYEVNPVGHSIFQHGTIVEPTGGWAFNGAVSPDRTVNASGKAHGANMVLTFNTSSTTTYPQVKMVSKVGTGPVSGFVAVFSSPGSDQGRDCTLLGGACRWGDYAGAVPDPAASLTAPSGRVWLSQMYSLGGGVSSTTCEWGTYNWAATP